ncbi:MAG: toll/interleukin-1 receptor domain-containing protein [Snowella sp.]|nr:toll/interleukin-1 receptor domain-containing protein [Snowella sp.]
MKIVIYKDNTLPLDTDKVCEVLNGLSKSVKFSPGKEAFRITTSKINCPTTYESMNSSLVKEIQQFDHAIFATNVQYDNNYFFESHQNRIIVSFFGWHQLTDLPITNGLVYFIALLLGNFINLGLSHDINIGCLNDFLYDKRGVNVGMRSAFVCRECIERTNFSNQTSRDIFEDIKSILNVLSASSRDGQDILELEMHHHEKSDNKFHVFLCHNSNDKPSVRIISSELKQKQVIPWLDEEQLSPGRPWQLELEEQIGSIGSAAVFVGKNGLGPWQENEIRVFLSEFFNRGCPVIPVILPDAPSVPKLPIFLKQMTWVDLRKDFHGGISRLANAVK